MTSIKNQKKYFDLIVHGKEAKRVLSYLLKEFEGEGNYVAFPIAGYFKEGDKFTCFDNRGRCCFVEQAKTKKKALYWCMGKLDTIDL